MLYSDSMTQTATYWAPGAADEFGVPALGAGQLIACRWQNDAVLFRDAERREQVSNAVVYVAELVEMKGYLALGDYTGSSPVDLDEAYEIRQILRSPSLSGEEELVKVML